MINEGLINEVVAGKLTKLSISKLPTWVDKSHTEGVELNAGKIISFWIKDGERVFGQPATEAIQKIIEEINIIGVESNEKREENKGKPENKTENIKNTQDLKSVQNTECTDAVIPETFSPALIDKWSKMKTIDRMLMFQHTPKSNILERPGNGGKIVKYVSGNFMLREANCAFLFDWDFSIDGMSIGEKGVSVWGSLTVNIDGKTVKRSCVGYEGINSKMNAQLSIKSATTDCIKKGLSLFGFNSDVYSGEV